MEEKFTGVYILGNKKPVLYTGVTNNLIRRIWEHQNNKGSQFTKKYNLTKLLYYELVENIYNAIIREKQIKNMSRTEKLSLIQENNHNMKDLSTELFSQIDCSPDELFSNITYE